MCTAQAGLVDCAQAPLRNELKLGFKQIKWADAIEFVDSFEPVVAIRRAAPPPEPTYNRHMPTRQASR